MKLIIAVIKPWKIEHVKDALVEAKLCEGMTVTEVKGFGRQMGHIEIYRGSEYTVDFIAKYKVEMVVSDDKVEQVIDVIAKSAYTGKIGDGKIFVVNVEQAVRVRTGEKGESVL